jgi:hypothetical protein
MNTDPVPMLSEGMFIVLASEAAWLALIEVENVSRYYEGLRIAETRSRNSEYYVTQIIREFFGRDALVALPASTFEALAFYLEHYEGRLQERVRQLAAVLLSGQLFSSTDKGGGARVPVTDLPQPPSRPGGATFDTITSDTPVAEAVA